MVLWLRAAVPAPSGGGFLPIPARGDSKPSGSSATTSSFSVSRHSWIVRTQSNVPKELRQVPDPPCVKCIGSGRIDCHHCQGRGRTNFVNLAMLPKSQWPEWCKTCGGSGLDYCNRCLGTGEYRDILGFHFMKMGSN